MTLAQMQARFFELKGKLAVGQILEEEFKRELERLRFQDTQGRWWMIGAQSGRWYYYDGARWLLGDPPEPPPPALGAGEPQIIPPATNTPRPAIYTAPSPASMDPPSNAGQTISVPYTYAPAPPPHRTAPPQPNYPTQPPIPPRTNGDGANYPPTYTPPNLTAAPYTPPSYPPNYTGSNFTGNPPAQPINPTPQQPARHNLGDALREDLSKVHLPQIQVPQIHAPNIHVPPQFIHTPAPIRKYQPPFILVGAVVIG